MNKKHKRPLVFRTPLQAAVASPYYKRKPPDKKIVEQILDGLARTSNGTAWNPVASVKNGQVTSTDIIYEQCPGACGHVWRFNIRDHDVANWIVNEINQRRHG